MQRAQRCFPRLVTYPNDGGVLCGSSILEYGLFLLCTCFPARLSDACCCVSVLNEGPGVADVKCPVLNAWIAIGLRLGDTRSPPLSTDS